MLISYKYDNFMSFRDKVEFSMVAPANKVRNRFPNNFVEHDNGYNLLKSAVIVGENAGGKSNFVRSLEYFKEFFQKSDSVKSYEFYVNNNNLGNECLRENNTQQNFEIEVTDEEDIYKYVLQVDYLGIVLEELYYKKNNRDNYIKILEVSRTKNQWGCDLQKCDKKECDFEVEATYELKIADVNKILKESLEKTIDFEATVGLFVTKIALLGSVHAVKFINIIKNMICPETIPVNYDIYKSLYSEKGDIEILNDPQFFEIFKMVDYSIYDIKIDEEEPFKDSIIYRHKKDGGVFSRKLLNDSSGVREFFAWSIQIYKVIYENKTVIADEMDRVLNPILSDRVVAYINGKAHKGQFIFTSHNVLHLDLKNYMKEQIYFISKDAESLDSELYSLADFPEVRYETTKVYEFYMKGILGGTAIE